ncbi:CPBP family intramembrane glutamic endopeptidase [Defluviimonas sp. SAOS-178_SWC]|uniref:CPBP family intramembrane glutamic endopeptidase n=1 Tax=Defluviimonas sp. SAOS-178_SWC TaxID=3121287 RepID=UPI0032221300
MRKKPFWMIGVAVYVTYLIVFVGTWAVVGADYTNLVGHEVVFRSLDLPLILGAIVLVPAISWLGWWKAILFEQRGAGPAWTMWAVLAVMACMIAIGLVATDWSALTADHIALIALAGILVGFNEEALTRGILVVSLRGSLRSEAWVCVLSSFLFGLLHLPNALFGIGLAGGVVQVAFATLAGLGFYALRRVSGTILVPMVMHGAWDFAAFTRQASGTDVPIVAPIFQFGSYVVALVAAIILLRAGRIRQVRGDQLLSEE